MHWFGLVSSIGRGARAFHRAPAAVVVGGLFPIALGLLFGCCGDSGGLLDAVPLLAQATTGSVDASAIAAFMDSALNPSGIGVVVGFLFDLVYLAANAFLAAGRARLSREVLAGDRGEFRTLFSGADCFVPVLLADLFARLTYIASYLVFGLPALPFFWKAWQLLPAIPQRIDGDWVSALILALFDPVFLYWNIGGLLVLAIITIPVTIYVFAGIAFLKQAIALDGMAFREALRHCWGLAQGSRIAITNMLFLNAILRATGGLCCIFGTLYTGSIATVAYNHAYLRLTGRGEDPAAPLPLG